MSWRTRSHRLFQTSNDAFIITAVCNFPNMNDTLEKNVIHYYLDELQNDEMYREIYAYYCLNNGNDFIPIQLANTEPRLNKLQELMPIGKGFFWCIGYVSPYLEGRGKSLNAQSRRINTPSLDLLKEWMKHYIDNYYGGRGDSIIEFLFRTYVRSWVYNNTPKEVDSHRRFNITANQSISLDRPENPQEYLQFIEEMETRNWYEFVVNGFK